jgi:hypothetical protein
MEFKMHLGTPALASLVVTLRSMLLARLGPEKKAEKAAMAKACFSKNVRMDSNVHEGFPAHWAWFEAGVASGNS